MASELLRKVSWTETKRRAHFYDIIKGPSWAIRQRKLRTGQWVSSWHAGGYTSHTRNINALILRLEDAPIRNSFESLWQWLYDACSCKQKIYARSLAFWCCTCSQLLGIQFPLYFKSFLVSGVRTRACGSEFANSTRTNSGSKSIVLVLCQLCESSKHLNWQSSKLEIIQKCQIFFTTRKVFLHALIPPIPLFCLVDFWASAEMSLN